MLSISARSWSVCSAFSPTLQQGQRWRSFHQPKKKRHTSEIRYKENTKMMLASCLKFQSGQARHRDVHTSRMYADMQRMQAAHSSSCSVVGVGGVDGRASELPAETLPKFCSTRLRSASSPISSIALLPCISSRAD